MSLKAAAGLVAGFAIVTAGPIRAAGSICDFDKPTGRCTGTIEFQRAHGSAKSYAAEIIVRSSARRCSKVEYYVNSTPYRTVMVNKNSEHESLFETAPISREDIQVEKCTTYADARNEGTQEKRGSGSSITSASFAGHWTGNLQWMFVSSPMMLDIQVSGNHANGSSLDGKLNYRVPIDGAIVGNRLTFAFKQRDQGTATAKLVLDSPTSGTLSMSGSGIRFSGRVQK
ncbi:hypothetical protein [Oryzifoliimicrobium ureilyticus]|uniref:hypothetical protein n=1 Tax=Oryzifoliimicrobium ureilyticus TaxID=3113724 RepID=UPI0030766A11